MFKDFLALEKGFECGQKTLDQLHGYNAAGSELKVIFLAMRS